MRALRALGAEEMLKCLEDRDFPAEKVRLFGNRSAGSTAPGVQATRESVSA